MTGRTNGSSTAANARRAQAAQTNTCLARSIYAPGFRLRAPGHGWHQSKTAIPLRPAEQTPFAHARFCPRPVKRGRMSRPFIYKIKASRYEGHLCATDTGRIELMAASMTVLEKIRTEIRALEHELDRREDQENDVFEIRVTSHTSNDRWCVRISTHYRPANQHVAESQQGTKAFRHLM